MVLDAIASNVFRAMGDVRLEENAVFVLLGGYWAFLFLSIFISKYEPRAVRMRTDRKNRILEEGTARTESLALPSCNGRMPASGR